MKKALLDFLVCFQCRKPFTCTVERTEGEEVLAGSLACPECRETYPILDGIPRILPRTLLKEQRLTAQSFGWEWLRFQELLGLPEYTEQFLGLVEPITVKDIRGKTVLDAGCGMGRYSLVCQKLGATQVVSVDISSAVEAAYQNTRHLPNVHVVQADIYQLPLRRERDFDFVFTTGVLHHLPDPRKAVLALAGHVKKGGFLLAWVYGRENNEWLLFFLNPVRRFTSRLPPFLLYALSFVLALPLDAALKLFYAPAERVPGLGFLKRLLPYDYFFWLSRYRFRHTLHVIFDQLSPPKAIYLERDEFASWFPNTGLEDVLITPRNNNSWRGLGRKT